MDKDAKFRERYESPKQNRNLPFWKSCLAENSSQKLKSQRRSLSADDSASVRSALVEQKPEPGNSSLKPDSVKKAKGDKNGNASAGVDDSTNVVYFSPSTFEGNWRECANSLGASGHYHTMPNPGRHGDMSGFSKRLFGSGRVGGPLPVPPGPPSFLPDGSLLTVYDGRRVPVRPPLASPHHHHHHHHPYHHGVPPYPPLYKRSGGECYYTPPQPDYYQRQPAHYHVHLPQRHFWQEPPVDYARTLGRTRREAPVSLQNNVSTATKPEMSKLKRLMFARAAANNNNNAGNGNNKEELKMCTWSPYTSYDMPDYSTPLRMKEKVKPPQKSLDELRF